MKAKQIKKSGVPRAMMGAQPLQSTPDNPAGIKSKVSGKKKPTGIEIDAANNGFTSRTRFQNDGDSYQQPETNVHTDENDVADFVKNLFSGGDAKSRRLAAAKASLK